MSYRSCMDVLRLSTIVVFFFNDTATTEIYTLSLHDALPIYHAARWRARRPGPAAPDPARRRPAAGGGDGRGGGPVAERCPRSEEHTSELQSRQYLVCRLLLEKKKNNQ